MKNFSRIYIEITNVCNLRCSFCIGNVRTSRFMDVDEFSHILEQIKPYTDHIYLHVLGEPLMHPQLKEILAIAHEFDMFVNITTNGTLLAKAQEILLNAPALRKVSISLHSMEKDSPYSMELYLQDVALFAKHATNKGILCELRIWNLGADDIDNEGMFGSLCHVLGLDGGAQEAAMRNICEAGSTKLLPKLFLGKAERFTWPSMDEVPTQEPVFCYGMRKQIAILCDGTVVPCCLDSRGDIALGNIILMPLHDILSSKRAQALYEGFSIRKPSEEICKRCGYARRF